MREHLLPGTRWVLFDADNTLYPSETTADAVTSRVTNDFLEELGDPRRYDGETISELTGGKNFRIVARELVATDGHQMPPDEVEQWAEDEIGAVADALADDLEPDGQITRLLADLALHYRVAVVTSASTRRLEAGLRAAGLDEIFPDDRRFSADDSLDEATTKPEPDVYTHALERLKAAPEETIAVEDSPTGTTSAVRAGLKVIGITHHVPADERDERREELEEAGASVVVDSWDELHELLTRP